MHRLLQLLILPVLLFAGWAVVRLFTAEPALPAAPPAAPSAANCPTRSAPGPAVSDKPAPDSRQPAGTFAFPKTLTDSADPHGRLRRTFVSDDPEALRQALLNAGADRLSASADGAYTASLPPKALAELKKNRRISVLPAGLPLTRALRRAIDAAHPDDRLRITFLCADEASRDLLAATLRGTARIAMIADLAVVAELSVRSLGNALRTAGTGVSAIGLRREGTLFGDGAPDAQPALREVPLPFTGRGERAAILDTGCSAGKQGLRTEAFHADLSAVTDILPQPWWALLSQGAPTDGSDSHGHGTHVAGILSGSGKASPGRRLRGWAPEARLFVQNNTFAGSRLLLPPDIRSVFDEAYAHGVRIHSDSWGTRDGGDSAYGLAAWAADSFVWEHPDFLPVFAAGNSGPHPHTLSGGSALGKNVLTVGALDRTGTRPAGFSSRGPTADSRPKPELYADGSGIIAASRAAPRGYAILSGTSMAAPAVAGMLLQLRQWLRENRGVDAPSAALLRALLISGADPFPPPVRPHGANLPPPPPSTFGRASLRRTVMPENTAVLFAEWTYGRTGSVCGLPFTQPVTGPLSATLAWIDAPADIGASETDVNRLALRLLDDSDTLLKTFDPLPGNTRRILLESLPAGDYTLCIDARSVPMPGGKAAVVLRLPDPTATHLLHAPVVRIGPGTSRPLEIQTAGPLKDSLRLETSANGTDYTVADQSARLDAPGRPGTFFYRFTAGGTVLCGPFAVTVGAKIPLTVTCSREPFPCEPIQGTSDRAAGEPILATAGPSRTWQISRAGIPTVTRRSVPVTGWLLTDTATGRRLRSGPGPTAEFLMPPAPATLTWH